MTTNHPHSPSGSMTPLLLTLATVALALAIFLLAIGEAGLALAPAALLLIMLAAAAFDSLAARRKLERHGGSTPAVDADARDSFPTMAGDDEVPLGATRESHEELSAHDLPPDHPSRPAVEEKTGYERPRPTTRERPRTREPRR